MTVKFYFYIFITSNLFLPYILYCNNGKNKQDSSESNMAAGGASSSSKKDSEGACAPKNDSSKSSSSEDETSENETSEDETSEDELSRLVKEHLRISKDIKEIKNELVEVDKAEELDKRLPESAKDLNSHANNLKERYGEMSNNDIREYLLEELERLQEGKTNYRDDIREAKIAKDAKGDIMEVDNLTGNKREALSTEEDSNSSKRHKSSNNDDSSGSSGPSVPSGPFPSGPSGPPSPSSGPDSSIASGSKKE